MSMVTNSRQDAAAAGWTFRNVICLEGWHLPPQVQGSGQVDRIGGRIDVLHKDGDRNREAALIVGCNTQKDLVGRGVIFLTKAVRFRVLHLAGRRGIRANATDVLPALRKSLEFGSIALAFFLGCDLRKLSISSSAAVALSSGFGVKQFMMKAFASSDMHSGTLGWILNMPTLMGEVAEINRWNKTELKNCICIYLEMISLR